MIGFFVGEVLALPVVVEVVSTTMAGQVIPAFAAKEVLIEVATSEIGLLFVFEVGVNDINAMAGPYLIPGWLGCLG